MQFPPTEMRDGVIEKILNIILLIRGQQGLESDDFDQQVMSGIHHLLIQVSHEWSCEVLALMSEFLLLASDTSTTMRTTDIVESLMQKGFLESRLLLNCCSHIARSSTVPQDKIIPLFKTVTKYTLSHRNSKIKIAGLSAIDRLIRMHPWKETYDMMCYLLGRNSDPNCVEISEFFNPEFTRKNFLASLIFDPNIGVRMVIAEMLISWVSTLEDRADIECHVVPFILLGTVDMEIGTTVWTLLEESINDIPGWVRTHARKFMPVLLKKIDSFEFGNITKNNVLKLLEKIISIVGVDGVREYMLELIALAQRVELPDTIMEVIAEDDFWTNVLLDVAVTEPLVTLIKRLFTLSKNKEVVLASRALCREELSQLIFNDCQ